MCCGVPLGPTAMTGVTESVVSWLPALFIPTAVVVVPAVAAAVEPTPPSSPPEDSGFGSEFSKGPTT